MGRRPRRRAVGDLHRARRRRDGAGRAAHRRARRATRCAARPRRSRPRAAADARAIAISRGAPPPSPSAPRSSSPIVVGSGIAAQRLSPDDVGLQLLENSIATGAGLVALILALGPVSGAHFNPVVTLADRLLGGITHPRRRRLRRRAGRRRVRRRDGRQPHVRPPRGRRRRRTPARRAALWLGEVVATFGLLLVILGVVRAGPRVGRARSRSAATSPPRTGSRRPPASPTRRSPSAARSPTPSPASHPSSVPAFIVMQLVGALVGRRARPVPVPRHPRRRSRRPARTIGDHR